MAATTVRVGDDVQAALNAAAPGDEMQVQPGSYTNAPPGTSPAPFVLPNKPGNGAPITIRSAALSEIKTVGPGVEAQMPNLVSPGNGPPALMTAPGAHDWVLEGVGIVHQAGTVYDLVALGDGSSAQNSLALVPLNLTLRHCYVRAAGDVEAKRGVALNCANGQLLGCYVAGFKAATQDSQAVAGFNGPGPFTLDNSVFEGAGENVLFGGAATYIPGLIPSDISITNCTFTKPPQWNPNAPEFAGRHWQVKNLLELKSAQRVKIQNNQFNGCWKDAQTGGFFLITPRGAQSGGTWCMVSDVLFSGNVASGCAEGIMIQGSDNDSTSGNAQNLQIVNNLMVDVAAGKSLWGWSGALGAARLFQLTTGNTGGIKGLLIDHNTAPDCEVILFGEGNHSGLAITNNIVNFGWYGILAASTTGGIASMKALDPGSKLLGNLIVGGDGKYYGGADNFYPADLDAVGFVNRANGDFRLSDGSVVPISPYKHKGTDGFDAGYTPTLIAPPVAPIAVTMLGLSIDFLKRRATMDYSDAAGEKSQLFKFP